MRFWTFRDSILVVSIGIIAALMMYPYWGPPTQWDPDGLFYQAQKEETQGKSRATALHDVFDSELASQLKEAEADVPPRLRHVDNPRWVEYSSQFYRRRWAVPLGAAAINPIFGVQSLETLALIGYVATTMLLYLLLRLRFSSFISASVSLATLLLPPMRLIASSPAATDSCGLALMIAGFICATLALDRDRRWIAGWIPIVLLLSFTRDLTIVLVLAVACVALVQRTRTAVLLTVTGVLASIPAPLIAGAPLQANLAYVIDEYGVPANSSWSFISSHYPHQLWTVIHADFTYPLHFSFPLPMFMELLVILAGAIALFVISARSDHFIWMMRAALIGGALTILVSVNYTDWRLELAMLPAIAVGVAMLAELTIKSMPSKFVGTKIKSLAASGHLESR